MDGEGFERYVKLWYSQVRKVNSDDVRLILDNLSAHGKTLSSFPGVEYFCLPPNVTWGVPAFVSCFATQGQVNFQKNTPATDFIYCRTIQSAKVTR